jgi:hypothetical protein
MRDMEERQVNKTDGPVLCPIKGLKRKHPDKVFLVMKFLS